MSADDRPDRAGGEATRSTTRSGPEHPATPTPGPSEASAAELAALEAALAEDATGPPVRQPAPPPVAEQPDYADG